MLLAGAGLAVSLWGCKKDQKSGDAGAPVQEIPGVRDWIKTANIYEVNIRQFSPEGNLAGVAQQLPRLKEMGVNILWFMPIHPISKEKRKGTLGSYYAVGDYLDVNPEYGTLDEFKALVKQIHSLDMRIILDWVPNHTGWDHPWITEHPEFYTKDAKGNIIDPLDEETGKSLGWTDVADLNYDVPEMRKAMTDAMLFWIREADIDGYRVDVAESVPLDFWQEAIPKLRAAKPSLFMLAEAEYPPHRNEGLFDMSYGWSFHHLMKEVAQGKKGPDDIEAWLKADRAKFKKGFHMHFTANHDENSWNGTEDESFGAAKDAMTVLAFTMDGMPLIYSGQESNLNKRLKFFEKDPIVWGEYERARMYTSLLGLKRMQKALWNGEAGGEPVRVKTTDDQHFFAYKREKDENLVLVLLNLSPQERAVGVLDPALQGATFRDVFSGMDMFIADNVNFALRPWGYMILVRYSGANQGGNN